MTRNDPGCATLSGTFDSNEWGASVGNVSVDQSTYEKLRFSATLMGCSPGEVVALLISRLDDDASSSLPRSSSTASAPEVSQSEQPPVAGGARWIHVYRVYKGQTFEAEFNPASLEVRITSAPWSGKVFPSPTAAAEAVVSQAPGQPETVNTNGRKFWKLRSGSGDLRTIVGRRR
ncbi:hypothetical protein GCM10009817_20840 [Terrabacter lapilli]|uniref:Uncharacterized protein n=1 Tax=Terrabacter lapilli TaxID=436231 RepID=A0ABP5DGN4_9MICO